MPPSHQSNPPPPSWQEHVNTALHFAEFPALTVMPFLRRRIGLRTLSWKLAVMGCLLVVVASPFKDEAFSSTNPPEDAVYFPYRTALPPNCAHAPGWLGLFALGSLVLGVRQKGRRWREMRRGIAWHTYHRGVSVFSFLPLEAGIAERFVDPAVCILGGFAIWHWFSAALGGWLIVSGLALNFIEQTVHQIHRERTLDAVDAAIDCDALSQTVRYFEQHPTARKTSKNGVDLTHAALSPEVEVLMAKRTRAKRPPPPPPAMKSANAPRRLARLLWGRRLAQWWQRRRKGQ
ncbi:MAG: hypothetical protein HY299_02755 [Verrucomicrobia bacterium]|nr:hypothetical protein [Verrucomicrobiota bacterium]